MRFECQVCEARFHDVDQTHRQQLDGLCPTCGHADIEEIPVKICPVLSMGNADAQTCIHESCATYNTHFQMCNMAIPGFLNARDERRARACKAAMPAPRE